jgi:hypothetical protein
VVLGATDAGERARTLDDADLMVLLRPSTTPSWGDFTIFAARAAHNLENTPGVPGEHAAVREWAIRMVARDRARLKGPDTTPEWSDAQLRAMISAGSLAVIVQHAPVPTAETSDVMQSDLSAGAIGAMLRELGLLNDDQAALTGRQVLCVFPSNGDAGLPSITLGFETRQRESLAKRLDSRVGQMVNALESGLGAGDVPPRDFAGICPEAVRVLPIDVPAESPIAALLGQSPLVCWSYPATDPKIPGDGWWLLTGVHGASAPSSAAIVSAQASEPHRKAVEALLSPIADDREHLSRRWVSLGYIRPVELQQVIAIVLRQSPGLARAANGIKSVEWRTWRAGDSDVSGEFKVRMMSE